MNERGTTQEMREIRRAKESSFYPISLLFLVTQTLLGLSLDLIVFSYIH